MYRKQKKIPTLLGLSIVILGLSFAVYFDSQTKKITSSASNLPVPENIHFSNITDSAMTVSWRTNSQANARIEVSDASSKKTYLDDLDSDNIPRPRNSHYFTLKNLSEDTKYSVKLISGDKCQAYNCPVFEQKTGIRLKNESEMSPVQGQMVDADKKGVSGVLVYLNIAKAMLLSGRSDSLGMWIIPLNNLRNQDLLSKVEIKDEDIVLLSAYSENNLTTQFTTTVSNIKKNPVFPPIVIGRSYDFTDPVNPKMVQGISTQKTKTEEKPLPTLNPQMDLIFPRINMDSTSDRLPRFRGTGKPDSSVSITINSPVQKSVVKVGSDGSWNFRPATELTPGTHSITVSGYDKSGKFMTITRNFVVLKSGESILGDSTPSASLTPSVTVLPTATVQPTIPSPTLSIPSPTAFSPSLTPTIVLPSPTVFIEPTAPDQNGR